MKILESYKKIAKSMLTEHAWDRKFGEPLPTLEDVMNEEEDVMSYEMDKLDSDGNVVKDKDGKPEKISVQSALRAGEEHPNYKQAKKIAGAGQYGLAQLKKKEKEEEPSGKLDADDFERDSETGKDYTSKFQGTDEPEDDEQTYSKEEIGDLRKEVEVAKKKVEQAKEDLDRTIKDKNPGRFDREFADDDYKYALNYMKTKQDELKAALKMNMKGTDEPKDSEESTVRSFADEYKETEENEGESAAMDSVDNNIDDYIVDTLKIKRGTPEYEKKFDEMSDEVHKQIEENKVTEKHPLRESYERIGGK